MADEDDCDCLIWEEHYDRCVFPAWLARSRPSKDSLAGASLVRDGERSCDELPRAPEKPGDRETCAAGLPGTNAKEVNA